jgi:hypothetical protein
MILLFLKIIILLFIIITLIQLISLQKYNKDGYIISTEDSQILRDFSKDLNPYLFTSNELSIYHKDIIGLLPDKDMNIKDHSCNVSLEKIDIIVKDYINKPYISPPKHTISLIKGESNESLQRCVHDILLFSIIEGEGTIYLFNPKHKRDILHKENYQIKKWGHKMQLKQNNIMIIPTNWYYLIETKDTEKIIYIRSIFDTYFTWFPNLVKDYISSDFLR